MTSRNQAILYLLSENRSRYTTIDQIAGVTGAGIRTIHRDLEGLERSLRLRGVRLERRRGYGIRLIDPLPDRLAESVIPAGTGSSVESGQRPMLILLYLIIAGDWIKLSELAHALYVSDSTISSDISSLESWLPETIDVERHKGTGVRLKSDELPARLFFLSAFSSVFPSYLIFGEPVSGSGPAAGEERLIRVLEIREDIERIQKKIRDAETILGYQFSPAYQSFLFSYLFLLSRRLPVNGLLEEKARYRLDIPEPYYEAAIAMAATDLAEHSSSPTAVAAELDLLSRVIASCETSTPPDNSVDEYMGSLRTEINAMLEHSLSRLEEKEKIWLHDDRILLNYLRMTIGSAARRIDLGLPYWKELGLSPYPGLEDTPEAAVLVSQFLSDLGRLLKEPTPAVVRREIQEASLALAARLETMRSRNPREIRVRILCYEGLGMSNYILAIARDVFPKGTVFNAMWDPDFEQSPDSDGYHLVISTFPIHVRGTRQLILNGDNSPEELRRQLKDTIKEMDLQPDSISRKRKITDQPDECELQSTSVDGEGYSLADIMSVIGGFFVEMESAGGNLFAQAISALDRGDCDTECLLGDFERRESFGSLVFEELNIRILHCRSEGIPEPRAGVIQTEGDEETILVLAAPLSARQSQTHALSEIVIALTDYQDFPEILARGSKREIQSHLLSIFGQKN